MIELVSSVIHILTVSRVRDDHQVDERDYEETLVLFAKSAGVTTASALLSLGFNLFVFKWLMTTISVGSGLFYPLLCFYIVGGFVTQSLDYFANVYAVEVRQTFAEQFRLYISQYNDENATENQMAFFDSIDVITAHIPAMIKIAVMVVSYGLYALYSFSFSMLLISALVGVVVHTVNRRSTRRLEKTSTEEKVEEFVCKTNRSDTIKRYRKYDGINTQKGYSPMLEGIHRYRQVKEKVGKELAFHNITRGMVHIFSHAIMYLYFFSMVAIGYIQPMDMFILLPFVEEVGKCTAKCVGLPLMASPTIRAAKNLISVWNSLVDEDLKVIEGKMLFPFSEENVLRFNLLILSLHFIIGAIFPAARLTLLMASFALLSTIAIAFPKSSFSQAYGYGFVLLIHPFHSYYREKKPYIKRKVRERTYGNTKFKFGGIQYCIVMPKGPFLVEGNNGAGKSLCFGSFLTSRLNKVDGYYPKESSMHVTDDVLLLGTGTYIERLATTFSVNKEDLEKELDNTIPKIIEAKAYEKEYPSTGISQLMFVLTALYKACKTKCKYVLFDEALYGLYPPNQIRAYRHLLNVGTENNIQIGIVHHGLNGDNFAIPIVKAKKIENTLVTFATSDPVRAHTH